MTEERRRDSDKRIDDIHEAVQRIEKILTGERGDNGICGRVGKDEVRITSIQNELTEHKTNHWQFFGLLIALAGVAVGIIKAVMR